MNDTQIHSTIDNSHDVTELLLMMVHETSQIQIIKDDFSRVENMEMCMNVF